MSSATWDLFRKDCIDALDRLNHNKISMEDAFKIIDRYRDKGISLEIIDFLNDTISEIDGFHEGYLELLSLLRAGASERETLAYMHE